MELYTSDSFDGDLERIKADCLANGKRDASILIMTFLEHIVKNDDAMDYFTKWKDNHVNFPKFNISAIAWLQSKGYYIYRCRPFFANLTEYRLIYAFDGVRDEIHMLAAVIKKPATIPEHIIDEKHYGYEQAHPISTRICGDYDALGLPRLC